MLNQKANRNEKAKCEEMEKSQLRPFVLKKSEISNCPQRVLVYAPVKATLLCQTKIAETQHFGNLSTFPDCSHRSVHLSNSQESLLVVTVT